MARYQINLTYDGTDFVGSQRQLRSRTVQRELEKVLEKLNWKGASVLIAGRTDTGVHASGQVAAFDLEWKHSLVDLENALNANLPRDLAVTQVRMVAGEFHPRFDATARTYVYRLFCQPARDPLRERFAWRVWPAISDLEELAEIWLGEHDFAGYGTAPSPGRSTIRTVMAANWRFMNNEWQFEIQANAFLYHMVRRIVHAQVSVAHGKITKNDLIMALENNMVLPSGLAPACGLTLVEVSYDVLERLV